MNESAFDDPAGTWNKRFEGTEYLFGTEPNEYLRTYQRLRAAAPPSEICVLPR